MAYFPRAHIKWLVFLPTVALKIGVTKTIYFNATFGKINWINAQHCCELFVSNRILFELKWHAKNWKKRNTCNSYLLLKARCSVKIDSMRHINLSNTKIVCVHTKMFYGIEEIYCFPNDGRKIEATEGTCSEVN